MYTIHDYKKPAAIGCAILSDTNVLLSLHFDAPVEVALTKDEAIQLATILLRMASGNERSVWVKYSDKGLAPERVRSETCLRCGSGPGDRHQYDCPNKEN